MNNLFKELIDLLNKEFKKFDLNESVQLNLSKLPEFDMQINNLFKHNKTDFFNNLQKNIIAERILGLPQDPRADKGIAFKDIPSGN